MSTRAPWYTRLFICMGASGTPRAQMKKEESSLAPSSLQQTRPHTTWPLSARCRRSQSGHGAAGPLASRQWGDKALSCSYECQQHREKCVWSSHLVWVHVKVALHPPAHHQQQHHPLFLCASSLLTLEPLTVSPKNHWHHHQHITSSQQLPTAHLHTKPCPSFRLTSQHSLRNKPFQKDSWAAGAAMLYNRCHHRLPRWYSLTSQKTAGFKTKSGFLILRQTELLGRRFC